MKLGRIDVDVGVGSKTEVAALERHVRSTLHNRPPQAAPPCPFRATNRLMHRSNWRLYSITSSARASSAGGMVSPRVLAVFRLMTSSNLVDCTTGRSTGFAPPTIRPA
jgi:hypothetical protein